MAHEAAVRLTLDGSQFMVGIKRTGDEVDKVAKKGKKGFDLFGAGANAARTSIGNLGSAIKNTLALAGSLGGAFTVGTALKGAVQLQRSYRQIAFGVRDANGRMLEAADVQKQVERSAANTGQANADMATSFRDLIDATGDLEFARGALDAIGHTSMATGAELGTLVTLADQLHTKFGIAANGMADAFAQVFDNSKKGGPKLEEFADVMSGVGAELLAAGLDGQQGLNFMLGALVQTDDRLKSLPKQVAGLKAVLRGLGDTSELTKLAGKLGLDSKKLINEPDAIARLKRIFGTGQKGMDALLGSMNEGEEKETMKILFTDPFQKALSDAQKSGLKGKAAIDRALQVFDKQIGEFGKANLTAADMLKRAEAERQTPEAQLTAALNRLQVAFSQPAIIGAINDLAKNLPKLAEVIAQVAGFAASHPIAATIMGIGGKVALDAAAGAASAAAGAWLKGLFGAGAAAAGGAATAGAAGAAGAGAAGVAAGGAATGLVAAAGAVVLPATIIAAVSAAVIGIGREVIGNAYETEGAVMKELAEATAAGFGGGSKEAQQAALDRLSKAYDAVHSGLAEGDIGGGAVDRLARSPLGELIGGGGPDSRVVAADQMKLAAEAMGKLVASLRGEGSGGSPTSSPIVLPETTIVGRVKVDPEGSRMIGVATATALGGRVLDVRIMNAGELGIGRANAGPGGSRGPMVAGTPRAGGGV
jgi:hypothetical protein